MVEKAAASRVMAKMEVAGGAVLEVAEVSAEAQTGGEGQDSVAAKVGGAVLVLRDTPPVQQHRRRRRPSTECTCLWCLPLHLMQS